MLVAVMEDGHLVGYLQRVVKHRTIAELDLEAGFRIGSKKEQRIPIAVAHKDSGADGLQIRSTLPDAPCGRCGARGWCGHNGRISA